MYLKHRFQYLIGLYFTKFKITAILAQKLLNYTIKYVWVTEILQILDSSLDFRILIIRDMTYSNLYFNLFNP